MTLQSFTLSDGQSQGLRLGSFNSAQTRGFQQVRLRYEAGVGGVDVLETRGLGPVRRLAFVGGGLDFGSDTRRRFQWGLGVGGGLEEGGGWSTSFEAEVEWAVSDRFAFEVEAGVDRDRGRQAWAANERFVLDDGGARVAALAGRDDPYAADNLVGFDAPASLFDGVAPLVGVAAPGLAFRLPVFGARDTRQVDLTTRAQLILTPTLSVQLYGQLFAARGRFRDAALLAAPDDLRPIGAFPKRRDFAATAFNSNAVLRWEYRPGSTLFVVWSQGRGDDLREEVLLAGAGPSPYETTTAAQLGDAFGLFPRDVVLVKVNYLLMR